MLTNKIVVHKGKGKEGTPLIFKDFSFRVWEDVLRVVSRQCLYGKDKKSANVSINTVLSRFDNRLFSLRPKEPTAAQFNPQESQACAAEKELER